MWAAYAVPSGLGPASYLYSDGEGSHFPDQETFETLTLNEDKVGDATEFLVDGLVIQLHKYNGNPIGLEVPPTGGVGSDVRRAGRARRLFQLKRDQGREAANRSGDPGCAVHQGRREGEGLDGDAGVRRPSLAPAFFAQNKTHPCYGCVPVGQSLDLLRTAVTDHAHAGHGHVPVLGRGVHAVLVGFLLGIFFHAVHS